MNLRVGSDVGPYTIESVVGAGSSATVYRARHRLHQRVDALKVFHDAVAADASFQARFYGVAEELARLKHPNIVQLFDVQAGDKFALAMEFVSGGTALDLLRRYPPGTLPLPVVLKLTTETADALEHAHRNGICHGDIDPGSILLSTSGAGSAVTYTAKLRDFGLAQLVSGTQASSKQLLPSSLTYMAPEHFNGAPCDAQSDLYSLGVVLYQLVVGEPPFEPVSWRVAKQQHLFADVPRPSDRRDAVPPALDAIILRLLAKQPEGRYPSADHVAVGLRRARLELTKHTRIVAAPQIVAPIENSPPVPAAIPPNQTTSAPTGPADGRETNVQMVSIDLEPQALGGSAVSAETPGVASDTPKTEIATPRAMGSADQRALEATFPSPGRSDMSIARPDVHAQTALLTNAGPAAATSEPDADGVGPDTAVTRLTVAAASAAHRDRLPMLYKVALAVGFVLLLLALLLQRLMPAGPSLSQPPDASFGAHLIGAIPAAEQLMTFSNSGGASLSFHLSIAPAGQKEFTVKPQDSHLCGMTALRQAGLIAAHSSCTLVVSFLPRSTGQAVAYLLVLSNAGERTVRLSGSGVGTLAVRYDAAELIAPTRALPSSAKVQFTLVNRSVAVLAIKASTSHTRDFSIVAGRGQCLMRRQGDSCTLALLFRPRVSGRRTGTLVLEEKFALAMQTITKIERLDLRGDGAVFTTASDGSAMASGLRFGRGDVGTSSLRAFTMTVAGITRLPKLTGSITGAKDFSIAAMSCGWISSRTASCTVRVRFLPTFGLGTTSSHVARTAELRLAVPALGWAYAVPLQGQLALPLADFGSPSTIALPAARVGTTTTPSTITVANRGTAPLLVARITHSTTDSFAVKSDCVGRHVLPGRSCRIEVDFRPQHAGLARFNLVVATNDPDLERRTASFTFNGIGVQLLTKLPPVIDLGGVHERATVRRTKTFTIAGIGGDFTVTPHAGGGDGPDYHASVSCEKPDRELVRRCVFAVAFHSLSPGRVGTQRIAYSISAHGLVVLRTVVTATALVPRIQVTPVQLQFSPVAVGRAGIPNIVTVKNVGSDVLRVATLNVTGDAVQFEVNDAPCHHPLEPRNSCSVSIQFAPKSQGLHRAALEITSTALGGPVVVGLVASAMPPTQTPTQTRTPTATSTPIKTPTPAPTATKAPTLAPTATKAPTQAPTATKAPTQAPTATKAPTLAPTATKAPTLAPTATKTPAPTKAPTFAATVTASPSRTSTPISTPTIRPAATPRATRAAQPATRVPSPTAQPATIAPTAKRSTGANGNAIATPHSIVVRVDPNPVAFRPQRVGTRSAPMLVLIDNTGITPIYLGQVTISGADTEDFAVQRDLCSSSTTPLAHNVPCSLYVVFTPIVRGHRSATLYVPGAQQQMKLVVLEGTAL